jgi:hypothetical protein
MRANISQLLLYMECPRKWYFKYILKRGFESTSKALEDGLAWHDLMEAAPSSDLAIREEDPLWMKAGYDAWLVWKEKAKKDGFEFLAKELELEAPLGPHTIFGRLDALVRWNGRLWHLQHKTLSPSVPIPTYQRLVARSWHEHAYQHLIGRAVHVMVSDLAYSEEPYGGTLLVICRKLSDKSISKRMEELAEAGNPFAGVHMGMDRSNMWDGNTSNLDISYLPLPQHEDTMNDLWSLMSHIEESGALIGGSASQAWPIGNSSMCAGYYRNSLCPYIDVCDGHGSILDMPSINPFSGYKDGSNPPL